jgi:hypothetical protein
MTQLICQWIAAVIGIPINWSNGRQWITLIQMIIWTVIFKKCTSSLKN